MAPEIPNHDILEPLLVDGSNVHAFNTLRGNVTDDSYSGFNVCHYTGDDPGHVAACRRELSRLTGVADDRLIIPRQTHSNCCRVIDSLPVADEDINGTDALVTALPDVIIGVSTADCVPVVFNDPVAGVIGVAHAGWRGALGGITDAAIEAMVAAGATPRDIRAAMGPCICVSCFEVGEEVASLFPEEVVVRDGVKPHVDLPRYVRNRLLASGLTDANIAMPRACTKCQPHRYFSARNLGIASGRVFTFITKTAVDC